jgi:UDP-N-acetylglucosamine acyltransferase
MHNRIHPTVIIEGDVRLGRDNVLLPYTVLQGPLEIGDDNIIGPLAVIGGPGQDTRNPRYDHSAKPVRIGSHNIIREHVAIQKPIGEGLTVVGDYAHLMHGAHIPHDAWIEDHAVVTPGAVISGFARILAGANLGINCAIHQHCVIGQFSLVAMGAAVSRNVRPFSRYIPGKPLSVNTYAIEKYGFGKHATEIMRYVLQDVPPVSKAIAAIVHHYERLHEASGRQQYR